MRKEEEKIWHCYCYIGTHHGTHRPTSWSQFLPGFPPPSSRFLSLLTALWCGGTEYILTDSLTQQARLQDNKPSNNRNGRASYSCAGLGVWDVVLMIIVTQHHFHFLLASLRGNHSCRLLGTHCQLPTQKMKVQSNPIQSTNWLTDWLAGCPEWLLI